MLQSDVDTITNLCLTKHIPYCHNPHFWNLKFEHDGLLILGNPLPTLNAWRKEYLKVDEATIKAHGLLNRHGRILIYQDIEHLNLNELQGPVYDILAMYKITGDLYISRNLSNQYRVKVDTDWVDINIQDLLDLLTILYYHCPKLSYTMTGLRLGGSEMVELRSYDLQ